MLLAKPRPLIVGDAEEQLAKTSKFQSCKPLALMDHQTTAPAVASQPMSAAAVAPFPRFQPSTLQRAIVLAAQFATWTQVLTILPCLSIAGVLLAHPEIIVKCTAKLVSAVPAYAGFALDRVGNQMAWELDNVLINFVKEVQYTAMHTTSLFIDNSTFLASPAIVPMSAPARPSNAGWMMPACLMALLAKRGKGSGRSL